MDELTQKVLERAYERELKLKKHQIEKNVALVSNLPAVSTSLNYKNDDLVSETRFENDIKMTENTSSELIRNNCITKFSSNMPASPKSQLKTLNIQKENFNVEIKLDSAEEVRLEVEIEERFEKEFEDGIVEIQHENKSSKAIKQPLREDTKKCLNRLGKVFGGGDDLGMSSPIHRTEDKFPSTFEHEKVEENKENDESRNRRRLRKLADLAKNIDQWEDDISPRKKITEKNSSNPKKMFSKSNTPQSNSTLENNEKTTPKTMQLDQKLLKTLESQGFTRTESSSRLVYNYKNDQERVANSPKKVTCMPEKLIKPNKVENEVTPRSCKKNITANVANKAAVFESSPKQTKDPALLSVSERKALFEKNEGIAPIPKILGIHYGVSPSPKTTPKTNNIKQKQNEGPKVEENCQVLPTKTAASSEGIAKKITALLENKTTISQQQIEKKIKEDRKQEMDVLLNRCEKFEDVITSKENLDEIRIDSEESEDEVDEETQMIKEQKKTQVIKKSEITPPLLPPIITPQIQSPTKRAGVGDSPKVAAVLEDVKRIKIIPPKDGKLYPCLSDIETATETETEFQSDSPTPNSSIGEISDSGSEVNTSFGRELLKQVCKSGGIPQKKRIYDESTESDLSDILNDMDDDYLDDAIDYKQIGPTPRKHGRSTSPDLSNNLPQSSNSFNYKSFNSPKKVIQDANTNCNNFPIHLVDGNDVLPLTHTISFYRKQQSQNCVTPVKQIVRQPTLEEQPEAETLEEGVDKKIQELWEEVTKQQTFISQSTQALNLCYSTAEFTGSTEQVEAEKHLLLATHRRQAVLNEIQRLKVEGTLRPKSTRNAGFHVEKGTLTISKIMLPLKKEYARALAAAGGKGHHIICLIKCDDKVISTKLVSTVGGTMRNLVLELTIPGELVLENIRGDFTATFEVYCLQAQEEVLPHEVKYHIYKKQNKSTPKKTKGENRLIIPPKGSPAGPNAVRSPSFAPIGYVVLSVQAIEKKQFTLNKTPSMSPLEGTVHININYQPHITVKCKGFLTRYEDVSGFGAWHRRWFLLQNGRLVYWKYPDDEKKTVPINSIDLRNCITETVGPVSRELCARLNTFLFEIERDAQPEDKESLVTIRKGNKTVIRHLLSADSKEERIEWCEAFNKALAALRFTSKVSK